MKDLITQFQELIALPEPLYSRVIVAALDAEWFEFGGRNVVLSYQVAAVSDVGAANVIHYTPTGERLRCGLSIAGHLASPEAALCERLGLAAIVKMALMALHDGKLPDMTSERTLVVLVAHNAVAEWSVLADRDNSRVTKRLDAIRKCPVTGRKPIELHSRETGLVAVELYDTMLLAPAGFKSLAALSEMLGETTQRKIDIPEFYKRQMNRLLSDDPALFEKYALRDTEVTLRLFFLLQKQLNVLANAEL